MDAEWLKVAMVPFNLVEQLAIGSDLARFGPKRDVESGGSGCLPHLLNALSRTTPVLKRPLGVGRIEIVPKMGNLELFIMRKKFQRKTENLTSIVERICRSFQ